MNNVYLRRGIWLFVFSFCFALFCLFPSVYKNIGNMKGKFVFASILEQTDKIKKIELSTPEALITLIREKNLWRVAEADLYYAGYRQIESLFDFFKNARIQRNVELSDAEFADNFAENATEIVLYDESGKKLMSLIAGRRTYNNKFIYIRFPDSDEIYMAGNAPQLPENVYSWLQQPLLSLNSAGVQDILIKREKGDMVVGRDVPGYPFWLMDGSKMVRRVDAEDLLNQLQSVYFIGVKSVQNFDEQLFSRRKEFRVTTFDGVIIDFILFYGRGEYWLKENISLTSLPTSAARQFAKDSKELSEYWYFQLSEYAGSRLWNTEVLR